MKILLVAEKEGTAIHRLCEMTAKSAPWHEFRIVCVHPKRPNPEQIREFTQGLAWCDLVDFRYWKTAELLKTMFSINKPNILTHNNPYDLERSTWSTYNKSVVVNKDQLRKLKGLAVHVPHPVDLDFWDIPEEEILEKKYDVNMVANRIEGKKGVREVAQACHELGLKMSLVGAISDPNYFADIMAKYGSNIEFFEQISNEQLRDLYYQSKIHICNSVDNFEAGTMPILEAMACGTPVLTRRVGHVPDFFNARNMIVRRGAYDDIEDLKQSLSLLVNDEEALKELKKEGRFTLRYSGLELYGRRYSKIYHDVLNPEKPLISVVIPVASKISEWKDMLAHVLAQTYKPLEIIISDDSEETGNEEFIDEIRKQTSIPIKYFRTATFELTEKGFVKRYGLARARNKAILEAEGEYIAFIDERMIPAPDAIERFYERRNDRTWLWGVKDGVEKGFVENFSFVLRKDVISIGMFSEQITQYGGMTQEVRKRAEINRMKFEMVVDAKASTSHKSRNRWRKNKDIAKSKMQCYKLYEG